MILDTSKHCDSIVKAIVIDSSSTYYSFLVSFGKYLLTFLVRTLNTLSILLTNFEMHTTTTGNYRNYVVSDSLELVHLIKLKL